MCDPRNTGLLQCRDDKQRLFWLPSRVGNGTHWQMKWNTLCVPSCTYVHIIYICVRNRHMFYFIYWYNSLQYNIYYYYNKIRIYITNPFASVSANSCLPKKKTTDRYNLRFQDSKNLLSRARSKRFLMGKKCKTLVVVITSWILIDSICTFI